MLGLVNLVIEGLLSIAQIRGLRKKKAAILKGPNLPTETASREGAGRRKPNWTFRILCLVIFAATLIVVAVANWPKEAKQDQTIPAAIESPPPISSGNPGSDSPPAVLAIQGSADPDCCEWVPSYTRADGPVKAHWRSRPGCDCDRVTVKPEVKTKSPPQIYVGPRGGHYHYGKNGNKVYEHRK